MQPIRNSSFDSMSKGQEKNEGFDYDLGLENTGAKEDTSLECWEFMDCPSETRDMCPAYPRRGHECWKVTGTRCGRGRIQKATRDQKIEHCRHCSYYRRFARKF